MVAPTWQFMGDEHLQSMFRYMRDPIAGRIVADVIGSAGSTYASWIYCSGPCGLAPGATRPNRSGLEIYVDDEKAPVVTLLLGSNPGPSAALPANFVKDVRYALSLAGKHGAQVILVGPFANDPGGRRLAALRSLVPDTIDGMALAAGLPRAADGVHFTEAGYATLAARMIEAVFETVADRSRPGVTPPAPPPPTPPTPPTPEETPAPGEEPALLPDGTPKAVERSRYTVPLIVGGVVVVGGLIVYAVYRSRRRRG